MRDGKLALVQLFPQTAQYVHRPAQTWTGIVNMLQYTAGPARFNPLCAFYPATFEKLNLKV